MVAKRARACARRVNVSSFEHVRRNSSLSEFIRVVQEAVRTESVHTFYSVDTCRCTEFVIHTDVASCAYISYTYITEYTSLLCKLHGTCARGCDV